MAALPETILRGALWARAAVGGYDVFISANVRISNQGVNFDAAYGAGRCVCRSSMDVSENAM
jgi:hypothetical protein